ncbi:MAG: hypothetical protein K9J21_07325 [Bacteroidales bacterium]|nr:hypothetical protein [Bacteroidales bacterium]
MEIKVKTGASVEPVDTNQVKQYIKFAYNDDTDEVSLLDNLISAVRTSIEMRTGLVLTEKTYEILFNQFDGEDFHHSAVTMNPGALGFRLPVSPVYQITKIETIDLDDEIEELTKNTDYYQKGSYRPIILYPLAATQELIVTCTAGYGNNTESCPADIKEAIKKQVGRWYWNRDDYIEGKFIDEVSNIVNRYALP